jgi:hypothetical protein
MIPEVQRIKIAEACGWIMLPPGQWLHKGDARKRHPSGRQTTDGTDTEIPDYLNDLNAAAALCDVMADLGWFCGLANGLDKTWECEFYRPATSQTNPDDIGTRVDYDGGKTRLEIHYSAGTMASLAIARCFIRALNLWDDSK